MSKLIRWGILGCGRIAHKFAADLLHVEESVLQAVGSRNLDKAREFAKEHGASHVHGRYEDLVSDPEVDVIYIASPHGLHHEHSLLCLEHGKAVLCEKAFALNSNQVKEMVAKAKEKKVFLMEALWTKFLPHYQMMQQMLKEGKLGEVQNVLVNFGFLPQEPVPARLLDPALGGGTLLDIGIYNVFIALSVLGRPDIIESSITRASTGVDEQCAILFKYKNGAMAQLFSSFSSNLSTEADISGNKGRIRLASRFYEPGTRVLYYPGRTDSEQNIAFSKEPGWGYQYEARHVAECLRAGLTESPIMSFDDSLLLMETLDRVRSSWQS